MEYKPTKSDIEIARQIYNDVILTQTLKPFSIIEAYKRLFGSTLNQTIPQMKNRVFLYFQYQGKIEESSDEELNQELDNKIDKRTKEYKESLKNNN